MISQRRKIDNLTEIDPVFQALLPFMAGLDREDQRTAAVIDTIEGLFLKLKQGQGSRSPSIGTALDLQERRIFPYGLDFKDDAAKAVARARGAQEAEGTFPTLENTKALISLVRQHMSRTSLAGSRVIIDVIFLRLASLLSTDTDRLIIIPGWSALDSPPDGKQSLQGVIDYLIAKRPSKHTGLILSEPVGALNRPDLVHSGSSNVFEARTSSELVCSHKLFSLRREFVAIHSAVACGDQWVFFAYQAPKGNDYAKYARTEVLEIGQYCENLDLILGLLVDWMQMENAEVFGPQKRFYIV